MASIFTQILNGKIKGEIIYQDEVCAAIRDIQPQAPVHILMVPKKEIRHMTDIQPNDAQLLGHLLVKATEIARSLGLAEDGYRFVINTKKHGGQSVDHIHLHILGGRQMHWPPG